MKHPTYRSHPICNVVSTVHKYLPRLCHCSDSDDEALVRLHGGSPICDSQVEVKGDVGCTAGKGRFNGSGACVAGGKENTGKEKGQNDLAVHENLSSLSQDLVEPLSINQEDREGETRRRDIEPSPR